MKLNTCSPLLYLSHTLYWHIVIIIIIRRYCMYLNTVANTHWNSSTLVAPPKNVLPTYFSEKNICYWREILLGISGALKTKKTTRSQTPLCKRELITRCRSIYIIKSHTNHVLELFVNFLALCLSTNFEHVFYRHVGEPTKKKTIFSPTIAHRHTIIATHILQ